MEHHEQPLRMQMGLSVLQNTDLDVKVYLMQESIGTAIVLK